MIDTTKIKNHWNAMASGTVVYLDVERDTVFKLCDHIDELERKLKIAEDALDSVNSISKDFLPCKCNETPCDFCFVKDHVFAALKQIRGE